MDFLFCSSFFLYFSLIILVGIYSYLKQNKSSDFFLGNRTLSFWVSAIATNATDMSLWLFMAYPYLIYQVGVPGVWEGLGLMFGTFLNWHFIAPKLRTLTESYNASTIIDFFSKRFNDKKGILTITCTSMALIFFTIYISAGIVAFGRLFSSIFDLEYSTCITIGTAIVALYTILGGFVAVSLNNFLKGIFILLAIVIVPAVAFAKVGGFAGISLAAAREGRSLFLFEEFSFTALWTTALSGLLSWGISYPGQLHILVNFMGIKKVDEISQAKYLSSAWQTIALASATLTGLIGIAYFKVGSINPELLFRTLTTDLFGSFWSGFILCAVLAAGIASIAIQILFLATTLAHDIYKRFFNPNTSINNLLFISRSTVILVSGIAWLLALHQQNTIHALVKHAWTGLGCSFGPLVIAALYGKKITAFAATMGVLVGGVMVLASSKLGFSPTDPKLPFTVGSLIIFGISYISNISKPEKRN